MLCFWFWQAFCIYLWQLLCIYFRQLICVSFRQASCHFFASWQSASALLYGWRCGVPLLRVALSYSLQCPLFDQVDFVRFSVSVQWIRSTKTCFNSLQVAELRKRRKIVRDRFVKRARVFGVGSSLRVMRGRFPPLGNGRAQSSSR